MKEFIIYTDGSANSASSGGSACIVQDQETMQNYYLLASFGKSTNNQAELFATFLGYAFLRILNDGKPTIVKIVSDSQYVLAGSTKYIKRWVEEGTLNAGEIANKAFWVAFLVLTKDLYLDPEHVRGHRGHGENEKCDAASGWARKNHGCGFSSGNLIEIRYPKKRKDKRIKKDMWFYLDLESVFGILRDETSEDPIMPLYHKINSFLTNPDKLPIITTEDRVFDEMVCKLEEAVSLAHKYSNNEGRILSFKSKVEDLLKDVIKNSQ